MPSKLGGYMLGGGVNPEIVIHGISSLNTEGFKIEIEIEIVYNMYRMRRFTTKIVCAGCCLLALPSMPYKELTSQG
jgi:hypothetical protein